MNSHLNPAASRCGLFDTLPTQTSFVQLWNSISRSGKIRIQFSFHHIWFQSTIDYTQNIQDQDRICIKFNKIKKDLVYFWQKFLPSSSRQSKILPPLNMILKMMTKIIFFHTHYTYFVLRMLKLTIMCPDNCWQAVEGLVYNSTNVWRELVISCKGEKT